MSVGVGGSPSPTLIMGSSAFLDTFAAFMAARRGMLDSCPNGNATGASSDGRRGNATVVATRHQWVVLPSVA